MIGVGEKIYLSNFFAEENRFFLKHVDICIVNCQMPMPILIAVASKCAPPPSPFWKKEGGEGLSIQLNFQKRVWQDLNI